nr:hypothetical protein HK105_004088 [Polyrhizophydium stewartii]
MWKFECASVDASRCERDHAHIDSLLRSVPHCAALRLDKPKDDDTEQMIANLKIKKAWDTALAGGKSIPMNAFMLYMSGNSIQIFSILITVMLLFNSVKAIMGAPQVFERFQTAVPGSKSRGVATWITSPLFLPLAAYVLIQGANLGLGVWKCGAMGLLPTATSDWLAFLEGKQVVEHSFGAWL